MLFGLINVESIQCGNLGPPAFWVIYLTRLVVKISHTMCTCPVYARMQRNVEKGDETLTRISDHCICPMHGLSGWCSEDNTIKIENILSNDESECFMFYDIT